MKKIKINSRIHHLTLIAFRHLFIETKELEAELFTIYEEGKKI
jgi:uncharacterized protein (UPF0332 family)